MINLNDDSTDYDLFRSLFSDVYLIASNGRNIYNEFGKICREGVVAYFIVTYYRSIPHSTIS
jgi:hypothetical protein